MTTSAKLAIVLPILIAVALVLKVLFGFYSVTKRAPTDGDGSEVMSESGGTINSA